VDASNIVMPKMIIDMLSMLWQISQWLY